MADYQGEIARKISFIRSYLLSMFTPIYGITNDDNFTSMLDNKAQVSDIKSGNVKSKQGKAVETLALSKQFLDDLSQKG